MDDEPFLTEHQRQELEAALILALTMMYQGHQQQAFAKLNAVERGLHLTPAAMRQINARAEETSQSVQREITRRVAKARADAIAKGQDPDAAEAAELRGADGYNRRTLVPFLALWAKNHATADAYGEMPSDVQGLSLRDTKLFNWIRGSGCTFEDPCGDAASASPASFSTLVGIGGDIPPVHPNCQCEIVEA